MRRSLLVALALVVVLVAATEVARRVGLGAWARVDVPARDGRLETPEPSCAKLAAYLGTQAGEPIDPLVLRAVAEESRTQLEAELDRVALRLDSNSTDWRPVFRERALEHPASAELVLELYRTELARSEAFVVAHDLVSLPRTPIAVSEVGNRVFRESFPLAVYLPGGQLGVVTQAGDEPDPSYLANHCTICVPPLAVHEGVPGHHVGFSAAASASPPAAPELAALVAEGPRNLVVQEGWAQYAELLVAEHGYWDGRDNELLGALRVQLLRATRAVVDVAVHCEGLSRETAEALYVEELAMDPAAAQAELTRQLLAPGSKSTYLVGALQILALREALGVEAGGLRAFHDRLLEWPMPLPRAARERFGVELPAFPAGQLLGVKRSFASELVGLEEVR